MKKILLILALANSIACAGKLAPNSSPEAQAQFKALQVVTALSDFQDGVIAANTAEYLSDKTAITVVKAVQVTLSVVEKTPQGAKASALQLIDELQKVLLDPKLQPYLDSARAVLGAL
jgi:hypothetical protein